MHMSEQVSESVREREREREISSHTIQDIVCSVLLISCNEIRAVY